VCCTPTDRRRAPRRRERYRSLGAAAVVIVAVITVAAVMAACDSSSDAAPRRTTGTALTGYGPQLTGVLGVQTSDLAVGRVYGFAWPQLTNTSHATVTIESVAVQHVPDGVRVVRYRALSLADTPGYLLSSDIGEANASNYDRYRNHLDDPITIAAGKRSPVYPVVYVKYLGPRPATLSGCLVRYHEGAVQYQQAFHCEFDLGG
jgi:hypothetical protein